MARWTASAKWAAGPALDGQRDMPLGLSLSEGLGRSGIAEPLHDTFPPTLRDLHFGVATLGDG